MFLTVFLVVVLLIGVLVEMLTYRVGDSGAVTRFHRKYKETNVDLVLGLLISGWVVWKGNTFFSVIGVIIFIACGVIAAIRVDKRIIREIEEGDRE